MSPPSNLLLLIVLRLLRVEFVFGKLHTRNDKQAYKTKRPPQMRRAKERRGGFQQPGKDRSPAQQGLVLALASSTNKENIAGIIA
jgi:hypothetical protein